MDNNQLDPKALTLTKAIAMQEGGGKFASYDAPSGDEPNAPKGTAGGRYQFIGSTWKNYAQQVLGDANAPMTPENQNKVAYTKVKEWLDSGKTPAQAASMWNAGEGAPDAWKPGTKQAHGDTPTYVKNVQKYGQQLEQGQTPQTSQVEAAPVQGYAPPAPAGSVPPPSPPSGANGYTPPTPPVVSSANAGATVNDPHYIQNTGIDGKPSKSINWANPPEWLPTKYLGEAGGTLLAGLLAPDQKQKDSIAQTMPSGEQIAGSALQTGGDIAALASGGITAAPETLLGMAGLGAGLGAAQSAGSALTQNADTTDVLKQGATGGIIGGLTGAAGYGLGKLLNKLGVKSATLAVRPSAADFADGYDSQFAVDNGLTGNAQQIADKTKTYMQTLAGQLKQKLGSSNAGIDLASVFDKTKSELTSQGGLESNFLQNTQIEEALQTLEENVLRTNPSGELPLLGAQTVKQQTGMYGEWLNGAPDPEANAMASVANTFYRNLKSAIEQKFPEGEIANINAELQKAIPIMRAAIRRIPVAARAQAVSMTDMLGALGFSLNPSMIALPAFQHVMSSGLMSSLASNGAGVAPKITPTLSSMAPSLVGKVFPQSTPSR